MNISSPTTQDRRRFKRIQFDCTADLQNASGRYRCALIDISLKGVLLGRPSDSKFQEGSRLHLYLHLEKDVDIEMQVHVVFMGESHIGCCWEHIDIDSFSHLKRLMELNIGDSDLVLRELGELPPQQA
ncbi:MAG TPA: PilZ domain-containing protein [Gammaproteobacteria bacterium]|nr:PilZ domain-containing protein [Gammaproteobacteria bacterium]